MYKNILKKDLKRNKSFNVIVLILIIIASTFISSSLNNMIAITKGLNGYFDKVGLTDYIMLVIEELESIENVDNFLKNNENVKDYKEDEFLAMFDVDLGIGKEIQLIINSFDINQQKFLDENNKIITEIKDGEVYVPKKFLDDYGFNPGDEIQLNVDTSKSLFNPTAEGEPGDSFNESYIIAGICKDAFLGSNFVGNVRFIVNDNELAKLKEGAEPASIYCYSINTDNLDDLRNDINKNNFNINFAGDRGLIKMMYFMDMVMAGILLIVSLILILISFTILRFSILFAISEEYRDIGVMKAIGIKTHRIRSLYVIKQLVLSIISVAFAFILSGFVGSFFLRQVSKNIALESDTNTIFVSILSSMALVLIIASYSFFCTRGIKKITPVEAIRGISGAKERKRKGFFSLKNSKLATYAFLAVNDISSSFKKFIMLILTFIVGFLLIIVLVNTKNTLKSDNFITMFAMAPSDVFMSNTTDQVKLMYEKTTDEILSYYESLEEKLKDMDIDAEVFCESLFHLNVTKGELSASVLAYYGNNISTDRYTYSQGTAPRLENEIALTEVTAKEIDARIGDKVKIKSADIEDEYIVTAFFESMNNLGAGVRYSEKATVNNQATAGQYGIQVKYLDKPSRRQKEERLKILEELMPDYDIETAGEYITDLLGSVANDLDSFIKLILLIVLMINILVTILMVKSFLIKEKGEIAMLKSLGFRNFTLVKWQVTRIGILLLLSVLIALILSTPLSKIAIIPIFKVMGASQISFEIKPLEVFLIYPLIIFTVTLIASALTALDLRKVSPQEVINID